MKNFVRNEQTSKLYFVHAYSGISKEDLDDKTDQLLTSLGYKLIEGQKGSAVYEKGSKIKRLLLGAFSKYYKFNVVSTSVGSEVMVEVGKKGSDIAGGLIGAKQVRTELDNLSQQFEAI